MVHTKEQFEQGARWRRWLAPPAGWLPLLLSLLLLTAPARGQQPSLRHFGQLDGLPNLSVRALAQDSAGYLWVGTENGLYRLDGTRFQRMDRKLKDPFINSLHVDAAGRLWVGARSRLLLVDGERLRPVLQANGGELGTVEGQPFASADANHLLVVSRGGLHRVQPDGKGGWHGVPFFSQPQTAGPPAVAELGSILRDPDGTLWMGCGDAVCRYRDGALTVLGRAQGLPAQRWYSLRRDGAGTLWVQSAKRLMTLAEDTQRFSDRTPEHFGMLETDWTAPLLLDGDGQMVTANDNGLFRVGADGAQRYGMKQGLRLGTGVHALLLDRQGDLWLGLPAYGLVQWQGYRRWENWTMEQGLPHDDIWGLLRTRDGVLHAATGAGLARQRGGRFAVATGDLTGGGRWTTLAEDKHGDLWAGGRGWLVRRDRNGGRVQVVARLPVAHTYNQLLFDDAGRLWISTNGGLYVIDDPYGRPVPRRVEVGAALPGDDVMFLRACGDAGGRLWFATDKGLLRLDNGRWSRPLSAGGDDVFWHILCDGNTLWLGGYNLRLLRVDTSARQLRPVPLTNDVLEGKILQSLLVDRRHWLWLATDGGLMVWNGDRWRLLNQQSGMVWNDSNQDALMEDRDGSIWVGTSNGASRLLRPEEVFAPQAIPLQLASMRYGDAALADAAAPWSGAALDVQLAAPFYQNHEALSFRYRLLGQEEKWSTSKTGELRYAALAPGEYRLQLVADHGALQASSAVLDLPLTITPPWWRTRWAFAGGLLLAFGVIGLLHRYRVARVLRQKATLERHVAERTAALEASREELRLRSLKDGLTKAWNRTALMERLELLLAPGAPAFMLVLLDLDYFKRVNDTHGHLAGDEVLREVVRRAQASLRADDTVGRYGGEEFMLLMPGLDMEIGAPRLAQLHDAIRGEPVEVDGVGPLDITCSCGAVVARPALGLTPEQWTALADRALYRAKALGRDRIEYADGPGLPAAVA